MAQIDRVMRIEDQLCPPCVDLVVVENGDQVHNNHWVQGGIQFVHDQYSALFKSGDYRRHDRNKAQRTYRLDLVCV